MHDIKVLHNYTLGLLVANVGDTNVKYGPILAKYGPILQEHDMKQTKISQGNN